MTIKETAAMLDMIRMTYPKYAGTFTEEEKKNQVKIWHGIFRDDDPNIAKMALEQHIVSSEFAPTIADIKLRMEKMTNPSNDELWDMLMESARKSIRSEYVLIDDWRQRKVSCMYDAYDSLPDVLKKYAVEPKGLKILYWDNKEDPISARQRFDKQIGRCIEDVKIENTKRLIANANAGYLTGGNA